MPQSASLLTLQFLSWVAERPRTRADVLEAWHSCPHASAWEDCVVERLVRFDNETIGLTPRGRALLNGSESAGSAS
jgi:hypothetical protein